MTIIDNFKPKIYDEILDIKSVLNKQGISTRKFQILGGIGLLVVLISAGSFVKGFFRKTLDDTELKLKVKNYCKEIIQETIESKELQDKVTKVLKNSVKIA